MQAGACKTRKNLGAEHIKASGFSGGLGGMIFLGRLLLAMPPIWLSVRRVNLLVDDRHHGFELLWR